MVEGGPFVFRDAWAGVAAEECWGGGRGVVWKSLSGTTLLQAVQGTKPGPCACKAPWEVPSLISGVSFLGGMWCSGITPGAAQETLPGAGIEPESPRA